MLSVVLDSESTHSYYRCEQQQKGRMRNTAEIHAYRTDALGLGHLNHPAWPPFVLLPGDGSVISHPHVGNCWALRLTLRAGLSDYALERYTTMRNHSGRMSTLPPPTMPSTVGTHRLLLVWLPLNSLKIGWGFPKQLRLFAQSATHDPDLANQDEAEPRERSFPPPWGQQPLCRGKGWGGPSALPLPRFSPPEDQNAELIIFCKPG